MSDIGARATIQLTIEVDAPGHYGADWNLADLMKQAEKEAVSVVRAAIQKNPSIRIISDPKVTTVHMVKRD